MVYICIGFLNCDTRIQYFLVHFNCLHKMESYSTRSGKCLTDLQKDLITFFHRNIKKKIDDSLDSF